MDFVTSSHIGGAAALPHDKFLKTALIEHLIVLVYNVVNLY